MSDIESQGHSLITDLKVTDTQSSLINIRDENSKKMTDFRFDELNFPENSDDEVDITNASPVAQNGENLPDIPDIDDIEELTNEIEDKMNRVAGTIRGIDKRMSLNLRILSGITMNQDLLSDAGSEAGENNVNLNKLSLDEKKRKIFRRLKKMTEFSVSSLGLTSKKDKKIVAKIKE